MPHSRTDWIAVGYTVVGFLFAVVAVMHLVAGESVQALVVAVLAVFWLLIAFVKWSGGSRKGLI